MTPTLSATPTHTAPDISPKFAVLSTSVENVEEHLSPPVVLITQQNTTRVLAHFRLTTIQEKCLVGGGRAWGVAEPVGPITESILVES